MRVRVRVDHKKPSAGAVRVKNDGSFCTLVYNKLSSESQYIFFNTQFQRTLLKKLIVVHILLLWNVIAPLQAKGIGKYHLWSKAEITD